MEGAAVQQAGADERAEQHRQVMVAATSASAGVAAATHRAAARTGDAVSSGAPAAGCCSVTNPLALQARDRPRPASVRTAARAR